MKILKCIGKRNLLFVFITVVLIVFSVWVDLLIPDYTKKLTEYVTGGGLDLGKVMLNGAKMIGCALLSMGISILSGIFSAKVAADFSRTVRKNLFEKTSGFSHSEMNYFSTGSLITRTTSDVSQIQMLFSIGLTLLAKAPITAVWAIVKVSNAGKEWTMAVFYSVLFMAISVCVILLAVYPKIKKVQKLTDDLNNATRENLEGIRVIRAFNAEKFQEDKFEKVNTAITKNQLFTARALGVLTPVLTICMNGLTLIIYYIGAILVNAAAQPERAAVIGNMTAFSQYAIQIVTAFLTLTVIFALIPRTAVSVKRINEVLNKETELKYGDTEENIPGKKGLIEFDNVSFAYSKNGGDCLKNLTFTINPGETFAIIGSTGTGKTSLVNLIPRFYDVTGGEIRIGGVPIKNYTEDAIEKRVSIAPQKPVLFMGDVLHNLTYGSAEPVRDDDPKVREALDIANARFVYEKEEGIHAPVSQNGTNFSGGQKQRLSIARAVYKDSDIYIFDDTFSALDFKTDLQVRRALSEKLSGKTVIIVSQRIGTIRNADRILVLSNGEAVGIGTHSELLQNCPLYKEIALSQVKEEEL